VEKLRSRILHDDWKSMDSWLLSQTRYMQRELNLICRSPAGLRDWLRLRPPLMPIAVFFYCLFGKRLIFNGRAGLFYALQRTAAETILSLMVLEEKLKAAKTLSRESSLRTSESS
jgi:hypothetical protein